MATTFVPYQVDYRVENTSKTFGFSKKKITFRFGIANNNAIAEGLTGANCRGSEHEIIFVWSLNSGKRQILADGKEVHFSESGQNGWTTDPIFQHPFSLRVPNFQSSFRCHLLTQPVNPNQPGSAKPFDLRLMGVSYFSFSKIFQLGTPTMIPRPLKGGGGKSYRGGGGGEGGGGGGMYRQRSSGEEEDPYCTPEERKAIAQAKLESLKELRVQEATAHAAQASGGAAASAANGSQAGAAIKRDEAASLISFDDWGDGPPAPLPPPTSQAHPQQFMSSMTMDPGLWDQGGQQQYPQQQQQQPAGYPSQQAYGNYALGAPPPPPQQEPPQPPSQYPQQQYQQQQYQQQQYQQQQYPPQPPPQPPAPPAQSNSLTPFQQAPGQPQLYYQQPPQQQNFGSPPPPAAAPALSFDPFTSGSGSGGGGDPFGVPAPMQQPPQYGGGAPAINSPSNQTYNSYAGQTVASYGSAPAFAQPPQPQPPQPQPPQQPYYGQQQQYPPQQQQQQYSYAQPPPPQGYPQPY